jgi:hypothetical protein
MRPLITALFFLFLVPAIHAQDYTIPEDSIMESDGQLFMPFYPGTVERTLNVDPGVARLRPSQVNLLKRKLNACSELFVNDSLFQAFSGMNVKIREEIHDLDGLYDQYKWIPTLVEIGFYTILAKDSQPFQESTPDAWVTIHFNNPKKLVGNPVIQNIFVEPVQTDSWHPFSEYDRISVPNRVTAYKKHTLPWFEPVSREDFILTLITFFQSSIEKAEKRNSNPSRIAAGPQGRTSDKERFMQEMEKIRRYDPELAEKLIQTYESAGKETVSSSPVTSETSNVDNNIMLNTWREAVRKLRAEMNAMSPTELKSIAWWSDQEDSNVSGLTRSGYTGSRQLVRLNKNLIDKTIPGSSIQLIVAEWSMMPGLDFTDITGYNLVYDKLSQLAKNIKLWQKVVDLTDP